MVRREWLAESAPQAAASPGGHRSLAPAEPLDLSGVAGLAVARIGALAAALGLDATPRSLARGQLAIELAHPGDGTLELSIEPARPDGRYFRQRGGVGFWYGRTRFRSDASPPWLVALLESVAEELTSEDLAPLAEELEARSKAGLNPPVLDPPPPGSAVGQTAAPPDPSRPYARARVLGPADVERFFHVDYVYEEGAHVDQPPTSRIGVIYQCNQTCTFCELAEMNTHIPPARIFSALEASRARGSVRVILTGGEPTLCRSLVDYVTHARAIGFTTIELQTNATLLDKPGRAVRLREAGLTDAQVSLHGPNAEISDRLTGAPGTHRRTLDGVGQLLEAGVRVLLNHLIFKDNCHLLLEFVDLVEERWGRHRERIILQFHAPLNEFARVEMARRHIARYTDYSALLQRAIDRARSLGYLVKDLQDPTGIPALCVLGEESNYLGAILSQRVKPRLHRWESEWMTRVEACKSCELADACMGVPRVYIDLHGSAEFQAIRRKAG